MVLALLYSMVRFSPHLCSALFPCPLRGRTPSESLVFIALHFLRLAKPLTMQGSGKCLANAWRLTCPPAFVLSSPDSRSASLDAYTVQANAWRMARSVPSHSLRLCWIISWYVTLRTPRLVAKQRRRSGAMGRNILGAFHRGRPLNLTTLLKRGRTCAQACSIGADLGPSLNLSCSVNCVTLMSTDL